MSAATDVKPDTKPDTKPDDVEPQADALPGLEPDQLPDAKPAPAKRAPRSRSTSSTRSRSTRSRKRVDIRGGMESLYGNLGMGVSLIPSPKITGSALTQSQAIGAVIMEQAAPAAEAWALLADESPAVKAQLEKLLTASAWSAVVGAHLPILAAVATLITPAALGLGKHKDEPKSDEPPPPSEPTSPTTFPHGML